MPKNKQRTCKAKEDELPGYSQDEIAFMRNVAGSTKIRPDGMIELPLPFTEPNPTFPFNRKVALSRTKNTLQRMKEKDPEFFQKALEKFAQNVDRKHPRFEPVPANQKFNNDGHSYWIPQFAVKQKTAYEIRLSLVGSEMCIRDRALHVRCLPFGIFSVYLHELFCLACR